MRTVDEWMNRLKERSLAWLVDQKHPCVRGFNGREYDTAINNLVKIKVDAGEHIDRHRPTFIISDEVIDEKNVEIVSYGGKGGTIRIVHTD